MTEFSVPCPYCSSLKIDAFETMTRGAADCTNCPRCNRDYRYLILFCEECCEESAFSWISEREGGHHAGLTCRACGTLLDSENEPEMPGGATI